MPDYSDQAARVMQFATREAQRFNHDYVGTEHILLGLVKEGSGVAANVLKNLDVDLRKIRLEVEKLVQSGPEMVTMGKLPQTPRAKKVIEYSMEEARNLNHNYVGPEHILLGLLREQEGVAAKVLMNLGLKEDAVRQDLMRLLGGKPACVVQKVTYENFTDRARKVMQLANQDAAQHNHEFIGPEHILAGIVRENSGVASKVLKANGVRLETILSEIDKAVAPGPEGSAESEKRITTPRAKQVLEFALEAAKLLGHHYLGTEHLLLGLIRERESIAAAILSGAGLTYEAIVDGIKGVLGMDREPDGQADQQAIPATIRWIDWQNVVASLPAMVRAISTAAKEMGPQNLANPITLKPETAAMVMEAWLALNGKPAPP